MSRRTAVLILCTVLPLMMAGGTTGILWIVEHTRRTMVPGILVGAIVVVGVGMQLAFGQLFGRRPAAASAPARRAEVRRAR